MFTIRKSFSFDAAHHLPHLPAGHKCARPHGHTYTVTLELRRPTLDDDGFVLDYGKLDRFKRWIDETLDHRDLNEVCDFPTTAERLAYWLYDVASAAFPYVAGVEVCETPKTMARYEP